LEDRLLLVLRRWRIDGTWQRLNDELRERLRWYLGRETRNPALVLWTPRAMSVRTTGVGGNERGFDPAKKVEGRKRHLLVDTQGLVLKAKVHSAKVQDREGIKVLLDLAPDNLLRLSYLWMDAGYTGGGKGADWAEKVLGWTAQIVRHPPKLAPEEVM
jgi:transposase